MITSDPLSKAPMRILNKGADYFRSTSISSQSSDGRRKTAAERLEADKLKYVKSAKARQQRVGLDSASHTNDSTGSHSMGTASTGSPVTIDDDDISEYTNNDIHVMESRISGGQSYKVIEAGQKPIQKFHRSHTDSDFSPNVRFQNSNRLKQKSGNSDQPTNSQVTKLRDLNCGPPERRAAHLLSSKESRSMKSLSAYISGAKEDFKPVTSVIPGTNNESNDTNARTRQSRPFSTKSSKFRSSSVGANLCRLRETSGAPEQASEKNVSNEVVMSPRSQLKHVRQNLKKVPVSNAKVDRRINYHRCIGNENEGVPVQPTNHDGKPFTIHKNQLHHSTSKPEITTHNSHVFLRERSSLPEKSHYKGRPLSVIENRVTSNIEQFTNFNDKVMHPLEESDSARRRRRSSPGKDDSWSQGNEGEVSKSTNQSGASGRNRVSQRLKRRSLDLAHTIDNSLHLVMIKSPTHSTSVVTDSDSMGAPSLSNTPRQRKSWSKNPPSPTEHSKSRNRTSYHEDAVYYNQPGCRKSITEALEQIFTPLEHDDDMDTAYNSTSPDASMDCKTLVGQNDSSCTEKNNSVANSINNVLRGLTSQADKDRVLVPGLKTAETSTCQERSTFGTSSNGNVVVLRDTVTKNKLSSTTSSPASMNRHSNIYRPDKTNKHSVPVTEHRQWLNLNEHQPIMSQPLNRIDLAPTSTSQINAGISNSPMLGPSSRREVAPESQTNRRNTNSLSRHAAIRDEHGNTMKSQNTSSSASGDINKPLTALTASDLKPRRGNRGPVTHTTPIKPTYPYPVSNQRSNTKRHNNGPLSPTMSPNKQAAHMTSNHSTRSPSSTPYSSLKRTPTSSRSSSLKRNRQRSKSDVSTFQNELDRFFSTMGMDEIMMSPLPTSQDTLFTTALVSSESDFSFAGASAYVRDGPDESMEVDPMTAGLAQVPTVSIIEKNARVMRWLMSCKKSLNSNSSPRSPKHTSHIMPPPPVPNRSPRQYNPLQPHSFPSYPPPIPPRMNSYQKNPLNIPKESDV